MTAEEFQNQFDVLYNNITSNQAPGLDSYEKSVFLTKAQDEILKSYFSPRLNKSAEGFDGNEKRQIDFSNVVVTDPQTPTTDDTDKTRGVIDIPYNAMMVINEFATVSRKVDGKSKSVRLAVVPLSYQEYIRLSSKPYKRPNHYQAWRVISNGKKADVIVGGNDTLTQYTIRYVKRPYPIILEELGAELTINGYHTPYKGATTIQAKMIPNPDYKEGGSEPKEIQSKTNGKLDYEVVTTGNEGGDVCELDPQLHEEILQRAIELAKAAWQGGLDSQIALGVNSETNMGYTGGGQQQRQ